MVQTAVRSGRSFGRLSMFSGFFAKSRSLAPQMGPERKSSASLGMTLKRLFQQPVRSFAPGGGGSSLLRLPAEERRNIQIVGRNVLADFADVLLDLVDHVRGGLLHGRLDGFAPGLPGFRQKRRLLMNVFLVGVLEARGDDGDLDGVLHVVVLDGAEDDVRVFMRGLL